MPFPLPGGPGQVRRAAPSLEEWWARWLPAQDLAPSTLESYAQQYRHHLRPRWGSTPVARITSLQVAGFEKELHASGLASSTVGVVMTVLRDLLGISGFVQARLSGLIRVQGAGCGVGA
jgi:hypothetical protein